MNLDISKALASGIKELSASGMKGICRELTPNKSGITDPTPEKTRDHGSVYANTPP